MGAKTLNGSFAEPKKGPGPGAYKESTEFEKISGPVIFGKELRLGMSRNRHNNSLTLGGSPGPGAYS